MTCELEAAQPCGPVYRIGRNPDPWEWPDWGDIGGNRWDDPRGEYRVLYASSQRLGAFLETLARFQPDLEIVAERNAIDGAADTLDPGVLPASWLQNRLIGSGRIDYDFADVGHSRSIGTLRAVMAGRVLHYGIANFDASTLYRSAPRAFTQEISRLVYECTIDTDRQFWGIAYLSRLGSDVRNWAVFEPAGPSDGTQAQIAAGDPDLIEAARRLSITLASPV